jgi:hypothetical protein
MKLGSVCRADRAQSNGPTMRSLANFHIELEQFWLVGWLVGLGQ